MIRRVSSLVVLGLALAAGAVVSLSRADTFPHERHAGLFPTCLGCHGGIPTGEEANYVSVRPADCVRCHDGERERTVDWTGPTLSPSNVRFVHAEHIAEIAAAGDPALSCASCHGPVDGGPRMAVARAAPSTCTGCHAHEAPEHLAPQAECSTCHEPLPRATELPENRIAAFPKPASHDSDAFLFEHGALAGPEEASCAVCHAQASCTRCHLNADRVPRIRALEDDARVTSLMAGRQGEWPEPEGHRDADWVFEHAAEVASGTQSCANCHSEASCRTCHGDARVAAVMSMPKPRPEDPAGAYVERARPPGHLPDFATRHGGAAAANLPNCASCHTESQCADCHAGSGRAAAYAPEGAGPEPRAAEPRTVDQAAVPAGEDVRHLAPSGTPSEGRPGYHPENFMLRHGAEAFSVQTVCSDCHSTEVFCRDCHRSTGMSINADGGAGGAFHDAQPNWLFEHGRAARQGMESCASCHQQTSCLRCHSAQFGLRINPHGPGFDPDRVAARSTISCGICHTADQIPPP